MAGVTVTFRRLSGKKNRLAKVAQSLVSEVQNAMNAQIEQAVDVMRSEPPPRIPLGGGRGYVRTHTYANSWRPILARASGGRLEGGIAGSAVDPYGTDYTVAVGGDEQAQGQFEIHEMTGWPLAQAALEGRPTGFMLRTAPVPFKKRIRQTVTRVLGRED